MINLNEKWRIVTEENNIILQFFENRNRKKKDETEEQYEYTENFYYPNIKSALKQFLNKSLEQSNSVEQILKRIDEVENIINKL